MRKLLLIVILLPVVLTAQAYARNNAGPDVTGANEEIKKKVEVKKDSRRDKRDEIRDKRREKRQRIKERRRMRRDAARQRRVLRRRL